MTIISKEKQDIFVRGTEKIWQPTYQMVLVSDGIVTETNLTHCVNNSFSKLILKYKKLVKKQEQIQDIKKTSLKKQHSCILCLKF